MLKSIGRFFAALLAASVMLGAAPAFADKAAEDFVAKNATQALLVLGEDASSGERTRKFGELFDKFADLPRISDFVLGRYARALREDPALSKRWVEAFRAYALATYEAQLDQYRGSAIKVFPGSQDATKNGRFYSVVTTEVAGLKGGASLTVKWQLLKSSEGAFRVVDVALKQGDQIIWLAQQQRQDFLALLDKNNGDLNALLAFVDGETTRLRAAAAANKKNG